LKVRPVVSKRPSDTLLIVDDDLSLLETLALHFEEVERGGEPRFHVVTATTAEAGLTAASKSSPSRRQHASATSSGGRLSCKRW
jgi:ActR/RegA family two-component response regulator